MPGRIVRDDGAYAVEQFRKRQCQAGEIHLANGEAVTGPNDHERDRDGEDQRQKPPPDAPRESSPGGPGGNQIAEQRGGGGRGEENEDGELGENREAGTSAEQGAAPDTRLLEPHQAGYEAGGEHSAKRHVVGRQARMGEDGREKGIEKHGDQRYRLAQTGPGCGVQDEASDPEEGENGQAGECQIAFVVPVAVQDRGAFLVHVGLVGGAATHQEWAESHGDAGQRGVMGFVSIDALVEPLHAAGNVRRFVDGVVEDGVSRDDAQGSESEQAEEDEGRVLLDPLGGRRTRLRRRRVLQAVVFLGQFLLYNGGARRHARESLGTGGVPSGSTCPRG